MIASLPRFREDLTVSEQLTADGVVFVVKDPVRDRFFRLPEEAHFIAEQLDGKTELDVVRHRTEERFQTALPPKQLDAFVSSLTAAGLLDIGKKVSSRTRSRRVQGSLLYLRFRFFDPDRLFDCLIGKIRFFFAPSFLVVSAAFILSAVCIAIANWTEGPRGPTARADNRNSFFDWFQWFHFPFVSKGLLSWDGFYLNPQALALSASPPTRWPILLSVPLIRRPMFS